MSIIKTASWFTPLPDDHVRIGISRGVPRFGKIGKGYRMYRKLAPGPWFNSTSATEFTSLYGELLGRLDPQQVHDDLMRIADGRVPVLCCFERVGGPQWCHRSQAAVWLAEALGIAIPELGFEDRTQAQHPLRAPVVL
jgi:hypothetical protein